jgi:hypothetical protein
MVRISRGSCPCPATQGKTPPRALRPYGESAPESLGEYKKPLMSVPLRNTCANGTHLRGSTSLFSDSGKTPPRALRPYGESAPQLEDKDENPLMSVPRWNSRANGPHLRRFMLLFSDPGKGSSWGSEALRGVGYSARRHGQDPSDVRTTMEYARQWHASQRVHALVLRPRERPPLGL